jgi:DNA-binding NtrC family response regulator
LAAAHILLVDDTASLRELLCEVLVRDGYDVHTASDGRAALKVLEARVIDVVVTDLRMPGMDGPTLLQCLHREHRGVPVILMSGDEQGAILARHLGAAAFVFKDRSFSQLPATVAEVLAGAATSSALAKSNGDERRASSLE